MRYLKFAVLLSALLGAPSMGWAQTTVPSAAESSRVGQENLAPGMPETTGPIFEAPSAPSAAQGISAEEAQKYVFTLTAVNFDGNTVYSDAELAPLYNKMIGEEISLLDVIQVTDKITAKYRNDGYVLSRAIVPTQTITDGVVTIEILEGFVDKVTLQGAGAENNAQLQAYAEKIKTMRPFNAKDGERYFLLASDLPGVTMRYVMAPSGTTTGATSLIMTIDEQKNFGGYTSIDNRGSRYLGPLQMTLSASLYNAFGMNDQMTGQVIRALDADELTYGAFNYSMPIGNEGTRANVQVSATDTDPGFTLGPLNVTGEAASISLGLTHPLIRSRDQNLQLVANLGHDQSREKIAGAEILDDRITALRIGADYQVTDNWKGANNLGFRISQGLDMLAASDIGAPNLSRTGGDPDFTKFNASASRLQGIAPNLNLLVALTGQMSNDALLSGEQFGLGGPEFLRGYDASTVVGDNGWAGKTELQYNWYADHSYLQTAQLYGFWDIGQTHYQSPVPAGVKQDRSLASVGLGSRFRFTDTFSGFLEVAQPLTYAAPTNKNKDTVFYLGATAQF